MPRTDCSFVHGHYTVRFSRAGQGHGIHGSPSGWRVRTDHWCRRRGRVDLQRAGQDRSGQNGGVAGRVRHGGGIEIGRRDREGGGVLAGRHRVAEGQRIGAGATHVGGGAAVVERQRRRPARDRHRLAQVHRQSDDMARIEVAVAVRDPRA